ncbi:MAG: 50S ribosome-binding GTPase [Bacteroidales bacterium]|nr:50S ribosome-binding GTPase [Bacteroidales bacterium]
MKTCRVAVLTPPGSGAIATLTVVGDNAWDIVRARLQRPGGRLLPIVPTAQRFWFGTLGDSVGDEVVVAQTRVEPEPWVEIHCHGGQAVVRWLTELLVQDGCTEVHWRELLTMPDSRPEDPRALEPLSQASTLRTANILLEQYHGAFRSAIRTILDHWGSPSSESQLRELTQFASLGRHLVAPWTVVVAGAPNVGKSSLLNALAGYARSIVAPVPGTTRDVVTVRLALDGWPIEFADTAGMREAIESLEAGGIARARQAASRADLVLWVMDPTDPHPLRLPMGLTDRPVIVVYNKADLARTTPEGDFYPVSALTGDGVAGLGTVIARTLVPVTPMAGAAVPFTPLLADRVEQAMQALQSHQGNAAREILIACRNDRGTGESVLC